MSSTQFSLRIDGMHCGSCVRRVSQALNATDGIQVEEVRIGAARMTSNFDAPPIEAAISSLAKIGFQAHLEA
jgi:copper chaperone